MVEEALQFCGCLAALRPGQLAIIEEKKTSQVY